MNSWAALSQRQRKEADKEQRQESQPQGPAPPLEKIEDLPTNQQAVLLKTIGTFIKAAAK